MSTQIQPVLVAVAGDGSVAAVQAGAREALTAQVPLHLVHVLDVPASEAYAGLYGGALEVAGTALAGSAALAREITHGHVEVTTERVDAGGPAHELALRGDRSRLVVLEHRHLGRAHRLVSGSTVAGVAAHTAAPVLSVPSGWVAADAPPVVTVGVQDVGESGHLLRIALDEADRRGARLVVAHAWWKAVGYDQAVLDTRFREQHLAAARRELKVVLEPLERKYPDTEVTLEVRHDAPAELLVELSQDSGLLVLGRRHHLMPLGSHLGPTVRAVLQHSTCPVLLAPHLAITEARRAPDRDFAGLLY